MIATYERSGSDSWCRETTLDEPPEDDGRKQCGVWIGSAVGRGVGISGIEGVFGRKREDMPLHTEISSSEQVLGEMENRIGFIVTPEEVALEHCEVDNVEGFSVEFERVGDGESSKGSRVGVREMARNVIGVKRPSWMEMDQWWRP